MIIHRNTIHFCFGILASLAFSGVGLAEDQLRIVDAAIDRPPSDATVLFDGGRTDAFLDVKGEPCQWPVVDKAMVVRDGFIVSKLHFRDAQIHVEFAVPNDGKKGEATGNSGVYIFGMYEMQIHNSYKTPVAPMGSVGALYHVSPPLVNAARKPDQWQVYDIVFTAPRRDGNGKVVQPGEITAMLNGVLVQNKTHFAESVSRGNPLRHNKTPYTDKILASIRKTDCGPLFLQEHGSPVRFRNVWIRPLDDKASVFKAE
jgi:hypothetical protein